MKNFKIICLLFLFTAIGLTSCQKDEYSLGDKPETSQIDYEVIQDYNVDPGGNTVILKLNSDKVTPIWNYGTGRSNRAIDTIRFAFKGEYTIDLDVVSAGGIVDLDPITISVTEDNLNYVNDPLWTALTGGVGQSKTWLLDLDEEGVSKYFAGPMYFYGTENGWLEGGDAGCYGDDCWNWSPDWAGNSWLMPAADFGYMTFSLDGGPYVTVDNKTLASGEKSGSFYLDKDKHTLSLVNAVMLHNQGNDACVNDWGKITVFSLTDDTMQLGVLRRDDCDGAAMLVYNFISKEYSDNYVPVVEEPSIDEGFDPSFEPGELLTMLTGGPSAGRVWKLDAAGNPIDWIAGGIGWTVDSSSSYNWGWNEAWDAAADDSWIRFDQWGGMNYTRSQNGVESTGTFSINAETNEITLINNTLIQEPGSWMNPTINVIKVIKAYDDYESKGIWFGTSYDDSKDEWFAFHYVVL
ncbi:MAG: hypothetical protein V7767_01515 [Leeuwenhoekiella sp.]